MFKKQQIAATNTFKTNILQVLIELPSFRATCSCHDLQSPGHLFPQICDKQQRRTGPSPCFDTFFFLLFSHARRVLMKILNSQHPETLTNYITECHCMGQELVPGTLKWAHTLVTPTAYFLGKPG